MELLHALAVIYRNVAKIGMQGKFPQTGGNYAYLEGKFTSLQGIVTTNSLHFLKGIIP
jgi:hypothetical protein